MRLVEFCSLSLWCLTGLLACSGPGATVEPPQQERPLCDAEGNLLQKDTAVPVGCYDNQTYGLDDQRLDRCYFRGQRPACAPYWRPDDPTPAGPYECTCNVPRSRNYAFLARTVSIADASDCESALEKACPFEALEPAACDRPEVGACGPVRSEPGRWTCQCEGSAELHDLRSDSCDGALTLACTAS